MNEDSENWASASLYQDLFAAMQRSDVVSILHPLEIELAKVLLDEKQRFDCTPCRMLAQRLLAKLSQ